MNYTKQDDDWYYSNEKIKTKDILLLLYFIIGSIFSIFFDPLGLIVSLIIPLSILLGFTYLDGGIYGFRFREDHLEYRGSRWFSDIDKINFSSISKVTLNTISHYDSMIMTDIYDHQICIKSYSDKKKMYIEYTIHFSQKENLNAFIEEIESHFIEIEKLND